MGVTFGVDDVDAVTTALPTRPLGEVAGEAIVHGRSPELRVVAGPRSHPLLDAVHLAFSEHRPLVLSPDVVWLTIAQGVAQHVRLHAEELRPRLVRHAGKRELVVTCPQASMPTYEASWREIVAGFRDATCTARARRPTSRSSTSPCSGHRLPRS